MGLPGGVTLSEREVGLSQLTGLILEPLQEGDEGEAGDNGKDSFASDSLVEDLLEEPPSVSDFDRLFRRAERFSFCSTVTCSHNFQPLLVTNAFP